MSDDETRPFLTVCKIDDVPDGGGRLFVIAETMIGVFRIQGKFFALANECPHAGASLAHGEIENDTVSCRIHHWKFCLRSGVYLDEDKPQFNARTFPTRVIGDEVQIELVDNSTG